jgi:hypothetical protein
VPRVRNYAFEKLVEKQYLDETANNDEKTRDVVIYDMNEKIMFYDDLQPISNFNRYLE